MGDNLRLQFSVLWMFHGAIIERSLKFAAARMELAERSEETDQLLREAAGEEVVKIRAALVAFMALGEELQ